MPEFTAIIVDDDDSMRNVLVGLLLKVGIEGKAYSTAEELLARHFSNAYLDPVDMPDLLVIDLQLKPDHMQGTDLIEQIAIRYIPSELIAISGVIPSSDFIDEMMCFGVAVLIPKPFGMQEFCSRAILHAQIGKRRRMRRVAERENLFHLKDETRRHRPVFISYADEDRKLANSIRINLESFNIQVWYAPTAVDVGSEWRREIEMGIDDAYIFIPFLSDSFLASSICLKELGRFRNRMDQERNQDLLLMPIVGDLSTRARNHEVFRSIADTYQYTEFRPRVSDCLTAIICRVQEYLIKHKGT